MGERSSGTGAGAIAQEWRGHCACNCGSHHKAGLNGQCWIWFPEHCQKSLLSTAECDHINSTKQKVNPQHTWIHGSECIGLYLMEQPINTSCDQSQLHGYIISRRWQAAAPGWPLSNRAGLWWACEFSTTGGPGPSQILSKVEGQGMEYHWSKPKSPKRTCLVVVGLLSCRL